MDVAAGSGRRRARSLAGLAVTAALLVPLACGGAGDDASLATSPSVTSVAPSPVAASSTVAAVTTTAAVITTTSVPVTAPVPAAPAAAPPHTAVPHRPAGLGELAAEAVVAPVSLRIDEIGVGAEVVAVGASPNGQELAVPPAPELVAWYQYGPSPGTSGSAVLAAHVAYGGEPGAFLRLADLAVDAEATVAMADGREVRFRVTEVQQVPKPELPKDRVFDSEGAPRLVLVTCGGEFETESRHYKDNIVAYLEAI